MKTLITTLLISAALLVGCMDNSSLLTAPDASTSPQTNSPIWDQNSDDSQSEFDNGLQHYTEISNKGSKKGGGGKKDSIDIDSDKDDGGTRYGFTR